MPLPTFIPEKFAPTRLEKPTNGIRRLINRHAGETIAIVGAGPTAGLFKNFSYDVSIGLNAASMLGKKFTYYLAAAYTAPRFPWFYEECSEVRLIAQYIALMDPFLFKTEALDEAGLDRICWNRGDQKFLEIPECSSPHITFGVGQPSPQNLSALISKSTNILMVYGTVLGEALQVAYLMGASQIDIFGCSFSEKYGRYFHDGSQGDSLYTAWQDVSAASPYCATLNPSIVEKYLSFLRSSGVRIVAHGYTTLKNIDEYR